MTNIYHATPYDISATGFYFSTYEEYKHKAATHKNEYGDDVEEFKIQLIDGNNCKLFEALNVDDNNLEKWFTDFEDMDDHDTIKAIYLSEYFGCNFDEILDSLDDITLFEGTAIEYAENYIEETGMLNEMPENFRCYFDYETFARDMILNRDINEFEIDGTDYVVWGI